MPYANVVLDETKWLLQSKYNLDTLYTLHGKKRTTCSGLMKTALNNVVLPILFNVVNNIVQHC